MRTWILFSAMFIAEAIRPEYGYPWILILMTVFLLLLGFAADVKEFICGKNQNNLTPPKE